jgi:hypothetical protein
MIALDDLNHTTTTDFDPTVWARRIGHLGHGIITLFPIFTIQWSDLEFAESCDPA